MGKIPGLMPLLICGSSAPYFTSLGTRSQERRSNFKHQHLKQVCTFFSLSSNPSWYIPGTSAPLVRLLSLSSDQVRGWQLEEHGAPCLCFWHSETQKSGEIRLNCDLITNKMGKKVTYILAWLNKASMCLAHGGESWLFLRACAVSVNFFMGSFSILQ